MLSEPGPEKLTEPIQVWRDLHERANLAHLAHTLFPQRN